MSRNGLSQDYPPLLTNEGPVASIEDDLLGAKYSAIALAELLTKVQPPFTIGIRGDWGSGKSTLLKLTESILDHKKNKISAKPKSTNEAESNPFLKRLEKLETGQIRVVRFNPWADSELVRNAATSSILIERFVRALNEMGIIKKKPAHRILRKIGRPAARIGLMALFSRLIPGSGEIAASAMSMPIMGHKLDENIYSDWLRKDLADSLNKPRSKVQRIIFFIDDLDRIDPEEAVRILDTISTLLNLEKCIFVVALDQDMIRHGVAKRLSLNESETEFASRQYFDKVINLSIKVGMSTRRSDLEVLAKDQLKRFKIPDRQETHLRALVGAVAQRNPRTLKRIVRLMSFRASEDQIAVSENNLDEATADSDEYVDLLPMVLATFEDAFPKLHAICMEETQADRRAWTAIAEALEYDHDQSNEASNRVDENLVARLDEAINHRTVAPFHQADSGGGVSTHHNGRVTKIKAAVVSLIEIQFPREAGEEDAEAAYIRRRNAGWLANYLVSEFTDYRSEFGIERSYPQYIRRYMARNWNFASVIVSDWRGWIKGFINSATFVVGSQGLDIYIDPKDDLTRTILKEFAHDQREARDIANEEDTYIYNFGEDATVGHIGLRADEDFNYVTSYNGSGVRIASYRLEEPLLKPEQFDGAYDTMLSIGIDAIRVVISLLFEEVEARGL